MTRRVVDLRGPRPLLDIATHGRGSPAFTPARREAIARTVGNVPEVVVKVSGGGSTVGAVTAHLRYIGRHGRLPLELDEGEEASSMSGVRTMLTDWGLSVDELESRQRYSGKPGIRGARIVHNLVFSMPAETSPPKVRTAVQNFAREQWALEHRYAMVLHTDTPRPHVHLVLKAVSEQGRRLYINKETLREWREEFARHLRAQGVSANATHRAVRGRPGHGLKDKIYRARSRGDSTFMRKGVQTAVTQMRGTGIFVDPAGKRVRETRRQVENNWRADREVAAKEGYADLADGIDRFLARMPPAWTDAESIAHQLREHATGHKREPIK